MQLITEFESTLPEILKPIFRKAWERYANAATPADLIIDRNFIFQLGHVLTLSDYITDVFCLYPKLPYQFFLEEGESESKAFFLNEWQNFKDTTDEDSFMKAIRNFRHVNIARIIWNELLNRVSFQSHVTALSNLAFVCVNETVHFIYPRLAQIYGIPCNQRGEEQEFMVLALGKLGANELNLSSDIDLMFAYPEDGLTTGEKQITNEQFFTRLGQQLIKILSHVTGDGFVYRVDMRLRPYGQSGQLVMNFDALENYYQYQGRDWERYALIKARVIVGTQEKSHILMQLLKPFVYRRYLDYGAFESLREMKEAVTIEVNRKQIQNNIKLGPGGIRQIEFLIQVFQLIRGGQNPKFQTQELLTVIKRLAESGYLESKTANKLSSAYIFLRKLEHRIQLIRDEQTHCLPSNQIDLARVVFSMALRDEFALQKKIKQTTQYVSKRFEMLANTPKAKAEKLIKPAVLFDLWPLLQQNEAIAILSKMGYSEPDQAYNHLEQFKNSRQFKGLKKQGLDRIDKLMPVLLQAVAKRKQPFLLTRMLRLLQSILRRSAYLALLIERPRALEYLIQIGEKSEWLLDLICTYPVLLDEILSPPFWEQINKTVLMEELDQRLGWFGQDDLEGIMDQLRQFKLASWCHLATQDILEEHTQIVAPLINDVSEVILERVFDISLEYLRHQYNITQSMESLKSSLPFGILAYGNLGARALGYASDLDLVFLYDSSSFQVATQNGKVLKAEDFCLRLAQRMIHILSTHTASGVLYEVDVRLRPGGSAGLLVSEIGAFQKYLSMQAWTYEHQALIKARMVVKTQPLNNAFEMLRKSILKIPRSYDNLHLDVMNMHQKIIEHRKLRTDEFKILKGGLIDIEFLVEFAVLYWAHQFEALTQSRSTTEILQVLGEVGVLKASQSQLLSDAYLFYQLQSRKKLLLAQDYVMAKEQLYFQEQVYAIWEEKMLKGGFKSF